MYLLTGDSSLCLLYLELPYELSRFGSDELSLACALRASNGPMSVFAISLLSAVVALSSDSSSLSVSSSVVVSVSSSFGGGGVGVDLFKKRLWKGFCTGASLAPAEDTRDRAVSGVPSMLPLARIFCFTSSVVYAAPVLRIALEDPADDSVDVVDSELAERVVFL